MTSHSKDTKAAAEGAALERLRARAEDWRARHLRAEFERDPARAARYRSEWPGLLVDWSKHRLDDDTLQALVDLANARGVLDRRDAMFSGEAVNSTEGRAVLHMALRHLGPEPWLAQGEDVMPEVRRVRQAMREFVGRVHDGRIAGHTGERFTHVVHIGIGGSDLGPAMACLALEDQARADLEVRFVANVDGQEIRSALRGLEPARTLVLVASKTFTTTETLTNARTARAFITRALGERAVADHFVALSANVPQAQAFGIRPERVFGFWDWVGGRYSMWSAIGMPIALQVGYEQFEELLAGAAEMDAHFRGAPPAQNLPLVLGLLRFWYGFAFGATAHAVLPYDRRLRRLPAYLQQADMESNGKAVTLSGAPVEGDTGPVVFGEPGTCAQHSFFQWLHQSPRFAPADLLVCARAPGEADAPEHHRQLLANALAQAEALAMGRTRPEVERELRAKGMVEEEVQRLAPHKVFEGNRPSTTWLLDALTPRQLGRVVAAFEHSIFVAGAMWGVNSFDQWGVELGKVLAQALEPELEGTVAGPHDASTVALLERVRAWRAARPTR